MTGCDDLDLFAPHVSIFARMGVKPRHKNARLSDAEFVNEIGVQDTQRGGQLFARDCGRHVL